MSEERHCRIWSYWVEHRSKSCFKSPTNTGGYRSLWIWCMWTCKSGVTSNSCQFPFSKRELYTSIKCPVVAVWYPPCSSWGQMLRGQHECCILRELCDAKLLDFRMASSPGYQMFKNPKQITMVSIQSSSTSHQDVLLCTVQTCLWYLRLVTYVQIFCVYTLAPKTRHIKLLPVDLPALTGLNLEVWKQCMEWKGSSVLRVADIGTSKVEESNLPWLLGNKIQKTWVFPLNHLYHLKKIYSTSSYKNMESVYFP